MPAGQLLQTEEPGSSEYVPAPQKTHTDEPVAPLTEEYEPARQLVHICAASSVEKVPAGQLLHTDESVISENVPTLHRAQLPISQAERSVASEVHEP